MVGGASFGAPRSYVAEQVFTRVGSGQLGYAADVHLLRALLRPCGPVLLCAALVGACIPAQAAAPKLVTGFVPQVAAPSRIRAAEPAQRFLSGTSRDYPPICDRLSKPRLEQAGATDNTDRVDIGAPAVEFAKLEGGRSYSYCFFVHNRAKRRIGFRVSAAEIVGSSDPNKKQQIIRPPVSVGTWIHPAITNFTLKPGERLYVPYVIDLPQTPPSGTTAAALEIVRIDDPGAVAGQPKSTGTGFSITMLHKIFITFPGGISRKLKITNVSAPSVLSHRAGARQYVAHFNVQNLGTVVDAYKSRSSMSGLGRTVAQTTTAPSLLLPNGSERATVRLADLPWIGVYHPKITVRGRGGKVPVKLPWLIILPPLPYVIALLIAVLLPIFFAIWRWRQRRQEWLTYLDEDEDEDEQFG